MSVLEDPSRIFNEDESSFTLCSKTGKVLARGEQNIYEIVHGSDKENITVLVTIAEDVTKAPPSIIYSYIRLPADIARSYPSEWWLGKSESGWTTGETFYEYMAKVFYPWLVKFNITLPILFFLDGHKSHLMKHLSDFCSTKDILLITLLHNTTHILQPYDVSIFKPLEYNWKKVVHKFRV
ncbi:hypothetical protein NQ314_016946 [Rhamnusium bicolor]|uniref:DDE-1 domain-containing protein n=1 Tax=Rhamnusium bicolor TaxID=1586634 RepID=A0AAV8WU25_9CUCU|nr:hypothetical protein NQ314_016946 [Rhamnusium bicolor]